MSESENCKLLIGDRTIRVQLIPGRVLRFMRSGHYPPLAVIDRDFGVVIHPRAYQVAGLAEGVIRYARICQKMGRLELPDTQVEVVRCRV